MAETPSFRDEVVRSIIKRIQGWHLLKLGIVWLAYILILCLWMRENHYNGGWLDDLGGDPFINFLFIVVTTALFWITWQWAGGRERPTHSD